MKYTRIFSTVDNFNTAVTSFENHTVSYIDEIDKVVIPKKNQVLKISNIHLMGDPTRYAPCTIRDVIAESLGGEFACLVSFYYTDNPENTESWISVCTSDTGGTGIYSGQYTYYVKDIAVSYYDSNWNLLPAVSKTVKEVYEASLTNLTYKCVSLEGCGYLPIETTCNKVGVKCDNEYSFADAIWSALHTTGVITSNDSINIIYYYSTDNGANWYSCEWCATSGHCDYNTGYDEILFTDIKYCISPETTPNISVNNCQEFFATEPQEYYTYYTEYKF